MFIFTQNPRHKLISKRHRNTFVERFLFANFNTFVDRFQFNCIELAEAAAQPDSETRFRARSLSQAHVDRLVHESYARVGRSRRYTLAQCCGVAAVIVVFVAAIVLRVVTEHIKV